LSDVGTLLGRIFFSEEKNQSTFGSCRLGRVGKVPLLRRIKVFCFFSSEKKTFPRAEAQGGLSI
jgi:hypothetical protein